MTSTRDALTILRAANPVPGPARTAAPAVSSARPRRRQRVRLLVAATAGVAVLAIAASVVPLPWTHGAATPAAAAALDQAATAADIMALDEAARPDQYWRISTLGTYLALGSGAPDGSAGSSAAWLAKSTRTHYVSVDGARPSWFVDSPATIAEVYFGEPLEGDTSAVAETWTTNLAPNDEAGSWQSPNPGWLAELPRETDALRHRLFQDTSGHGRSHDGEVLVYVADVLRSGLVPADLRAALFRVLETVPGVDIIRRHDDGLVAIGRLETVDGERQEILIDPATGAYVGDRMVQVEAIEEPEGTIPAGAIRADSRVTRTVVDDVPADVRAEAQHWTCEVTGEGGVDCQE